MATALILPDVHHRVENADHWLRTQPCDHAIFLGDFFDAFHDNVSEARRTAYWLRERMDRAPKDIFLLGNHDAAYLLPDHPELYCPGFTKAKAKAIGEVLGPTHWHRFKLACEAQGWLLSHAGCHPAWLADPTVPGILARCAEAMELARRGKIDPLLCAANAAQTPGLTGGGPLWTRWADFVPIPGINQIVGHTAHGTVQARHGGNSRNYCLDVADGSVAAVLRDGNVYFLAMPQEA